MNEEAFHHLFKNKQEEVKSLNVKSSRTCNELDFIITFFIVIDYKVYTLLS